MIETWKESRCEKVLSTRWVNVVGSYFDTSTEKEIGPYYLLEYPDWASVIAITDDHQVAVVRQFRPGIERVCLELPCGGVHSNETALDAAKRELLEETGCQCREWISLGSLSANPATHRNLNHCFLGTGATRMGELQLDKDEVLECEFVPLESLVKAALEGEILQSLHVASILMALPRMFQLFPSIRNLFH